MCEYPFKADKKHVIVNIAGNCNLKCPYCFIKKRVPVNIDKSDFAFLFETLGENIHFTFGGVADFFCGYRKRDRLLEYLLSHDVTIYFDFNDVAIHELPDLSQDKLDRLTLIDISYHYSAMKRAGVLRDWVKNVRAIAERIPPERYFIKMVVALCDMELWAEAITLYDRVIYPYTKKPLVLKLDCYDSEIRQPGISQSVVDVFKKMKHVTVPSPFEIIDSNDDSYFGAQTVPCPGGSRIFKIENNGQIKVCNYTWSEGMHDLGNLKERRFTILEEDILCPTVNNASCFLKMGMRNNLFPEYYEAMNPPKQETASPTRGQSGTSRTL